MKFSLALNIYGHMVVIQSINNALLDLPHSIHLLQTIKDDWCVVRTALVLEKLCRKPVMTNTYFKLFFLSPPSSNL